MSDWPGEIAVAVDGEQNPAMMRQSENLKGTVPANFVWKYQSLIELRAYGRLQDVILRDYRTFSGKALEDYYQHKFAECGKFTKIGNWWDRKGQNEIDIVAIDELTKTIRFCEVKRNVWKCEIPA